MGNFVPDIHLFAIKTVQLDIEFKKQYASAFL